MKKYLFILAATAALTSCYDDYVKDNDTQAVGFANQTDVRSVIVGEGMKFSTRVALGGTIENSVDRPISFEIDYSLVSDATLQAMKTHVFSYIQNLTRPLGSLEALSAEEYKLLPEGGTDDPPGFAPGADRHQDRLREVPRRRFAHAAQVCDPPASDRRQRHRSDRRQGNFGDRRAL